MDDNKLQLPTNSYNQQPKKKNRTWQLIYVFGVMFLTYATLSSRGGSKLLNKSWLGCGHRNASKLASALPAYRTLPSGDKIPSVALGVWQAGKGEVGDAVKVCAYTSSKTRRNLTRLQRPLWP